MSDLIDRQEAIDRFNVIRPVDPKKDEYTKGIDVGIAMCIVAVKDQPTIQPEPTNKVSFGDKDHVWIDGKQYISLRRFQEVVNEAQPKEGHWIEGGIYRDVIECYCSECGQLMTTAATVRMNYCPNCGAKMKGERQK
jgi:hypothetical protein